MTCVGHYGLKPPYTREVYREEHTHTYYWHARKWAHVLFLFFFQFDELNASTTYIYKI